EKTLLADANKSHRPKFHTLKVKDITREAEDCISVAFELPDNLISDYSFIPGQYLTLETLIDGEKVRRSYSLCSSPLDGELRVAIKKVNNGKFSTWANESLTVGTPVEVMTPDGKFHSKSDKKNKKN